MVNQSNVTAHSIDASTINETTPLNTPNQPTGALNQSNSTNMDNDTKRILIKVVFDAVLLGCG